ncbi:MAG: hypothetical protein EOO15_09435 [Chitinophagaceae bacterium]|nr:MAG: hypothetical protein EOO15_09435 [Chitinophagaceae bacterium]
MNTNTSSPTATPPRVSAALTFKITSSLSFGADHVQTLGPNYIIAHNRPPKRPTAQANASFQRAAEGGVPPYTYSSSDPRIAVVDQDGKVVAASAGTARILVTDSAGTQTSYAITFRGVVRKVYRRDGIYWPVPASNGWRPEHHALTRAQMRLFWLQYKDEAPNLSVPQILGWPNTGYWSADNWLGGGSAYAVALNQITPNFSGYLATGGTVLPSISRTGW